MTRVEELTLKLVDGEITAEEREELERLIAQDVDAKRVHVFLMEQEGALRGMQTQQGDPAAAVIARILGATFPQRRDRFNPYSCASVAARIYRDLRAVGYFPASDDAATASERDRSRRGGGGAVAPP